METHILLMGMQNGRAALENNWTVLWSLVYTYHIIQQFHPLSMYLSGIKNLCSPTVNLGLRVMMMSECRSSGVTNVPLWWGMLLSGEAMQVGRGAGGVWEISVLSVQFCCEPKTALKVLKKKKPQTTYIPTKPFMWLLIVALFLIAPNWKQPRCPSTKKRM